MPSPPKTQKGKTLYRYRLLPFPLLMSSLSVHVFSLLSAAPKKVSRHIVISTRPSAATPAAPHLIVYQDPPRPSYSKDVLKHTFVPYGARSQQTRSEDVSMVVVDKVETARDKPASNTATTAREKPAKTKEAKGKKRKVEGESPKKSKKHKTDA